VARALRTVIAAALVAATVCSAWAQPAPNPEQQRLQQERAQDIREMARQQGANMGVVTMAFGGDGQGNLMRMGGPGNAQGVPEQMILVDADVQWVFVIHGCTLYRYEAAADGALEAGIEVDLRTPDEVERGEAAEGAFIWPDPAMVPVTAEWSALTNSLMVLRGGVLMQFSPELESLAEFDMRTEREKQVPRIRVQMGPVPAPQAPPAPPPPDAAGQ